MKFYRATLLIAMGMLLVSCIATAGRAQHEPVEVQVERVHSVAIREYSALGPLRLVPSRLGRPVTGAIAISEFGRENAPRRGALRAAALIIVGFGDVGETPVGLVIWTTNAEPMMQVIELASEEGQAGVFQLSVGNTLRLLVLTERGQVLVDGVHVGDVE